LSLNKSFGDYRGLSEIILRELYVQRKIKTDRSLPDIEGVAIDVRVIGEKFFDAFGSGFGSRDRRVLRQCQIDDQLRPIGSRKKLLLDEP